MSEMHVQAYLRAGKTLHDLEEEYGVEAIPHPSLPLFILNYGLKTPPALKMHPIVRECRALVLEDESWVVVGRSFPRFLNKGEDPVGDAAFDWSDISVREKVDGSVMLLFKRDAEWMVTTRRSWARGKVSGFAKGRPETDKTWAEAFWECVRPLSGRALSEYLNEATTYVFEFVSPWSQVVRYYEEPALYLLAAFANGTGAEVNEFHLDTIADALGVRRPTDYIVPEGAYPKAWLEAFIEDQAAKDPTWEGVVVQDRAGRRLKVKSPSYVRLHRLHNNGAINSPQALLPLVLNGEIAEVLAVFPHLFPACLDVIETLYGPYGRMLAVWEKARGLADQKQFALFVTRHCPRLSSVLFQARKNGEQPDRTFLSSVRFAERLLDS